MNRNGNATPFGPAAAVASAEKIFQLARDFRGPFLGQVMAAIQRFAAHVACQLTPCGKTVELLFDHAVFSPQGEHRAA